ncbi:unnamed protein product [Rotaria socialis]|uniref:SF4 helicase domain-containing protein n=1 Tax=Rotaria socialis TaxID=392032 RepID=A0A821NFI1_9BILA|nr:unnamed protein product [Rotaria socialis]CAF4787201.1 unnamed protein product [Rotaria socialis]
MLSALIFRSTSNYLFVNPSIKQLFHSFNSINAPLSVRQPLIDPNPPLVGQAIEIKEFLRENSISFDESWTCIKALCCRSANKPLGFIHIGKERGDFACLKCATSGTWEEFKSQLQNLRSRTFCPKASLPLILLSGEENHIWEKSKAIADCDKDVLNIILSRYGFNEEYTLSYDTLQRYGLRIYQDQLIAPLYDADRSLVDIVVLDPISQTNTKPLKLAAPFGLNLLSARNAEIMLVDSIWDALCVYQTTGKVAIALPSAKFSIRMNMIFEHLRKIHIWYSNDKALAFRLANVLSPHRCFMIAYPMDAHGAFMSGQNLKTIMNDSFAVINKCIEQFDTFRELIRDELLQRTRFAGLPWQRFPMLTQILKGHRAGELTVLTGSTGCGKTTFLSEYSLDLCLQGLSTLFGSFEIQTHRLAKVMLTQYSGLNLSKNMDVFDKFAEQFARIPMFFMTFHGQESIDKVINTMGNAVAIHNIKHVVIDNLQFMMGMDYSNGDRFFKQDTLIHRFRTFATNNKCHVTIVIHPRKEEDEGLTVSSIFGSAKVSQESDNILIIQQKKISTANGGNIKYLQVAKNRFDGQLGRFALRFDKERLSFSRPVFSRDDSNIESDDHELQQSIPVEQ